MSNLQPYREAAIISAQPKKTSGIIRAPKPKIHNCNVPSFLYRLWCRITFRPIRKGSLYRCGVCGKVWRLEHRLYDGLVWSRVEDTKWEKAGGDFV